MAMYQDLSGYPTAKVCSEKKGRYMQTINMHKELWKFVLNTS